MKSRLMMSASFCMINILTSPAQAAFRSFNNFKIGFFEKSSGQPYVRSNFSQAFYQHKILMPPKIKCSSPHFVPGTNIKRFFSSQSDGKNPFNFESPTDAQTLMLILIDAQSSHLARELLESIPLLAAHNLCNGYLPLHRAIMSEEMVETNEAILEKKSWFTKKVETLCVLLAAGTNPNAEDAKGDTPLHLAAWIGTNLQIIQLLIEAGAYINARNDRDETPLHLATARGRNIIANALIAAGADVNRRDCNRLTPLHRAVMGNHTMLVAMLLEAGAEKTIRSKYDKTPLDLAKEDPHTNAEIITLLSDYPSEKCS